MRRLAALAATLAFACAHAFHAVTPGYTLRFPQDRGAHPGYRIEWWYVTGQLDSARGPLGFQVTFFRVRNPAADAMPGRFAPRQVLFAHAALADVDARRFHHDQRAGRAMEGLVDAAAGETAVRIDDWTLERRGAAYRTDVSAADFSLALDLVPTGDVLPEGERGFSRKGPAPAQASYYYSEPQLAVSGRVRIGTNAVDVRGVAWLDHEWSSEVLAPGAVGWDWLGANLDDGGALMAFRIRAADGRTLWSSATLRAKGAAAASFGPGDVAFAPRRRWRSPASGTEYPVAMDVRVGPREFHVEPLMDDQELDARATTGTLYWEGAVRVESADGARGRGYLELTGYAQPLVL
ncbi:MAG TPA: lipocalin-like domain-containing protein [Usitatibacter sp.]|jgi:predicted secreted hydrolase|nr:lipocalin-like domain-containing protein [Usitatibacter sp.]